MTVLIAGAGICGLALALTCHRIGVPVRVFEQVRELRPLGVGINLQPHAVRELFELGLEKQLDDIGLRTREVAYFTKHGLPIWAEPRGVLAGYNWPQYSIHRGHLQMMLLAEVVRRMGPDTVVMDRTVTGYEQTDDGVRLILKDGGGNVSTAEGDIAIAADGIHSALRAGFYPDEGPPKWAGAILWRATSLAKPFLSGATMAMAGHERQKFVTYPIGEPDPETGLQLTNWIAELKSEPGSGWNREDWNRPGNLEDFLPAFESWNFPWLDIPALIKSAEAVYEYPMVDRDPLPAWTFGRVTLAGDAAHPMYPIGSNGASQAILDARHLGRAIVDHGTTPDALAAYEAERRPTTSKIVLANRGNGPDQVMEDVERACGGMFEKIEDVVAPGYLENEAARYKALAGFDPAVLNSRPSIIRPDEVGGRSGSRGAI